MTCIVGLIENGEVYMGADSAGTDDNGDQLILSGSKIFKNNGFLMGATGSARTLDILNYRFTPPKINESTFTKEDMVKKFIPALQSCFAKEEFEFDESNILVGVAGNLFSICETYYVEQSQDIFRCIGSGWAYAEGAMKILVKDKETQPCYKIFEALKVAEAFNAYVKAPFTFLNTKGSKMHVERGASYET